MKFRLLVRRLSVSSPKMRVTSKLPWPVQMATYGFLIIFLLVAGALIYDWSTGFNGATPISWRSEVNAQRQVNSDLKARYDSLRETHQMAQNELAIERAAQQSFKSQLQNIEVENARLKEDLTYLQSLLPTDPHSKISIRRIAGEYRAGKISYQILLFNNANKSSTSFKGRLRVDVVTSEKGAAQTLSYPRLNDPNASSYNLDVQTHQRFIGELSLASDVKPKHLVAKIYEGNKMLTQSSFQF